MNEHAKRNASYTAMAAILMLGYGWTSEPTSAAGSLFFVWMLRLGGVGMVGVAILCFFGQNVGLLMDAVVSGLCGVIMILCGLLWIKNDGLVFFDIVVAIFGVMFVRAAWASWMLAGSVTAQAEAVKPPAPPEPVHPASMHPSSLPKDGEPPPPDGYLAALADEKQEPPTASYE